eukprot:2836561-Rhodomonas_salina.2
MRSHAEQTKRDGSKTETRSKLAILTRLSEEVSRAVRRKRRPGAPVKPTNPDRKFWNSKHKRREGFERFVFRKVRQKRRRCGRDNRKTTRENECYEASQAERVPALHRSMKRVCPDLLGGLSCPTPFL